MGVVVVVLRLAAAAYLFFFFNDAAPTEIYTLSLHDALPISGRPGRHRVGAAGDRGTRAEPGREPRVRRRGRAAALADRKSTRLNSSHPSTSYAVFCLKKNTIPRSRCTIPILSNHSSSFKAFV